MGTKSYIFAGGGTGGHIYPAIAVAEKIIALENSAKIFFFCSDRPIDPKILSKTAFEFIRLPAKTFSLNPRKLIEFTRSFRTSYKIAKEKIHELDTPVVVGAGGFVAAPVCFAAHRLKIPLSLLNVDIVPGRANKIISRWANHIFTQFEETAKSFAKTKAEVHPFGCPLRTAFENPHPENAKKRLALDENKKILLVTGASSGAASINNSICALLNKLAEFADQWQIVHLTGQANFNETQEKYAGAKITHKVLEFYDDMANLLAAADLCIGRSGAVSIAEYAAASLPAICMPYPHHKDMHQYLNAGKLVEAGAAIIVDDLPDSRQRSQWLWEELEVLLKNDAQRLNMKNSYTQIAKTNAASRIAEKLLTI